MDDIIAVKWSEVGMNRWCIILHFVYDQESCSPEFH